MNTNEKQNNITVVMLCLNYRKTGHVDHQLSYVFTRQNDATDFSVRSVKVRGYCGNEHYTFLQVYDVNEVSQ